MAGTLNLSLSQQFNSTGAPLDGGFLYFYAAGTTTPQSAYQDSALTLALPNPITLDSAGRVPAFFLADGQIKIRLTDSAGVVQVAADNLLVIGASSGAGSPPTVDATTILQTGDLKPRYGTGVHTGWVRTNGRTLGSATSGATERANSDCQTLFEYLWTADANLSVSTGRGASANADWVANKTITLPDWRGRVIAGLDDMGSSTAGRLSSTYFGAASGSNGITLGGSGGLENRTVAQANLPIVNLPVTEPNAGTGHVHLEGGYTGTAAATYNINGLAGGAVAGVITGGSTGSTNTAAGGTGIVVGTGGSGTPIAIVQPTMLATIYLKL